MGTLPTPTVFTTVLVEVLMTLTVLGGEVGHIGVAPVGGDGDPSGPLPTPTVFTTVLVEVLMTLMVTEAELVT